MTQLSIKISAITITAMFVALMTVSISVAQELQSYGNKSANVYTESQQSTNDQKAVWGPTTEVSVSNFQRMDAYSNSLKAAVEVEMQLGLDAPYSHNVPEGEVWGYAAQELKGSVQARKACSEFSFNASDYHNATTTIYKGERNEAAVSLKTNNGYSASTSGAGVKVDYKGYTIDGYNVGTANGKTLTGMTKTSIESNSGACVKKQGR